MDQEKRVLVAFLLSFVVLVMWRVFFFKEPPTPPKVAEKTTTAKAHPAPTTPQPKKKPPVRVALPVIKGNAAQDIVIEGGHLYKVTLSTQGAVVKKWILKKYRDEKNRPLNVVNEGACAKLGFPMSIKLKNPELSRKLNSVIYAVTPSGKNVLEAPAKVEFTYSDGKVEVRKQLSFGRNYQVHVEVSVFNGQEDLPVSVAWPGGFGDHSLPEKAQEALETAAYNTDGKIDTKPAKKLDGGHLVQGPFIFGGIEDNYFAGIFLPSSGSESLRFTREVWTPPNWKEKNSPEVVSASLEGNEAKALNFRMFVGPKDLDVLRAVKPHLDGLVNFGWFSVISKPLFMAMRYIYNHWVHNYGWAIVILTILINTALFPLKLKSIRSAQEMQRIAPLVKEIQSRYKQYKFNDPRKQRMNQEVMKLYQEHHINPLGGCLPMLLQLPLLYAFYDMLEKPIELRHAPWILWIKDLSAPDHSHMFGLPIPILPTIMIISMFALQKVTPMSTPDPAQQRMMLFMPLVFGIMFYRFASGLVLYFLAANLVGLAQQIFINRKMPLPKLAPATLKASQAKQ